MKTDITLVDLLKIESSMAFASLFMRSHSGEGNEILEKLDQEIQVVSALISENFTEEEINDAELDASED